MYQSSMLTGGKANRMPLQGSCGDTASILGTDADSNHIKALLCANLANYCYSIFVSLLPLVVLQVGVSLLHMEARVRNEIAVTLVIRRLLRVGRIFLPRSFDLKRYQQRSSGAFRMLFESIIFQANKFPLNRLRSSCKIT